MSTKEDDAMFWERLVGMPALEAEQECVLRRENCCLQVAMLTEEATRVRAEHRGGWQRELKQIGAGITATHAQLTKLNERIKELRKLLERIRWRQAVEALYGQEGVTACLVWMEQQGVLPGGAC